MLCLAQYSRRVIPLWAKPLIILRISCLLRILPFSAASIAQSRWVPQTLTEKATPRSDRVFCRVYKKGLRPANLIRVRALVAGRFDLQFLRSQVMNVTTAARSGETDEPPD